LVAPDPEGPRPSSTRYRTPARRARPTLISEEPDKRVLGGVSAFLRAGILTETGLNRETITGTPQGGILSPLLANIALSVLDEHFTRKWDALGPEWTRVKHRRAPEARP